MRNVIVKMNYSSVRLERSLIEAGISVRLVAARLSLIMEFPSWSHSSPQEDSVEQGLLQSSSHSLYVRLQNASISSAVKSLQRTPVMRVAAYKTMRRATFLLFIS